MIYFIIGNGGSGKSYCSRKLAEKLGFPVLHLDHVFFEEKHYKAFKSDEDRKRIIKEWISENQNGIIEGVYEDIVYWFEDYIDILVYLDISWEEAEKGLRNRKYDPKMTDIKHHKASLENFISYCKNYYDRDLSGVSKTAHDLLFDDFKGNKLRFFSRKEVNEFTGSVKSSRNK